MNNIAVSNRLAHVCQPAFFRGEFSSFFRSVLTLADSDVLIPVSHFANGDFDTGVIYAHAIPIDALQDSQPYISKADRFARVVMILQFDRSGAVRFIRR